MKEPDTDDDGDSNDDDDDPSWLLVTTRDIKPGEELLVDYTTFHDYANTEEKIPYFEQSWTNVMKLGKCYGPTPTPSQPPPPTNNKSNSSNSSDGNKNSTSNKNKTTNKNSK